MTDGEFVLEIAQPLARAAKQITVLFSYD